MQKYLVIDNFFDDPDFYVNYAKTIPYVSQSTVKTEGIEVSRINHSVGWRGYRSEPLHFFDLSLHQKILKLIFYKLKKFFNTPLIDVNIPIDDVHSYIFFNYNPGFILEHHPKEYWWHADEGYKVAGVIYLNKKSAFNSGTLLKQNNDIINIKNVYNRLVIYDALLMHAPANVFGESADSSRLTITFFIK